MILIFLSVMSFSYFRIVFVIIELDRCSGRNMIGLKSILPIKNLVFVLFSNRSVLHFVEGTKRKISENETESSGENKRSVSREEREEGQEAAGFKTEGAHHSTVPSSGDDITRERGTHPKESFTNSEEKGHWQGDQEHHIKPSGKRRHPTDNSQGPPRIPESKKILMGVYTCSVILVPT